MHLRKAAATERDPFGVLFSMAAQVKQSREHITAKVPRKYEQAVFRVWPTRQNKKKDTQWLSFLVLGSTQLLN